MFVLIDNYDSFTYNLWHYFGELGAELEVFRNDVVTADEIMSRKYDGIILSPGPCDPDQAGICLELIEKAKEKLPIFGVCLGHQSIGQAFGAKVVRAPAPMHGKVSQISHKNTGIFSAIPAPLKVTRYHSLTLDPDSLPESLEVTATSDDGVIMGVSHKTLPIHGVQFHPESIASDHGHKLLSNFLNLAKSES